MRDEGATYPFFCLAVPIQILISPIARSAYGFTEIRQQKPFESFLLNEMPLANYLYSIFLVFALLFRAQAHRECTSCISLEDLLTEAYGIELAVDGL